ncbi:MAG TPA: D-glucuronyl C5-epimerase family protein [Clostridia bacterium]|nr:D-glucuronyl C5-epimerase family protein [Clostridia bacterium]
MLKSLRTRLNYYRRIFGAYLTSRNSQLTFWHEQPEMNRFTPGELGSYYMTFTSKADYAGPFDRSGVPLLDYLGVIGRQHNPIAIAQYALGNYNVFVATGDGSRRTKFLSTADWLVDHLEQNEGGFWVWNHHFDFEYRTPLRAPWYSGLAQGQGISVLVRAYSETHDDRYLDAARRAFQCLLALAENGGVIHQDAEGNRWIEEYIVDPPTHILNGFMWALWGVYDFMLLTGDKDARKVWADSLATIKANLHDYDNGYWSLYEQSGTPLRMIASPFYHQLHIVQLDVMHRLTGDVFFATYADRWRQYQRSRFRRGHALIHKTIFKLSYY